MRETMDHTERKLDNEYAKTFETIKKLWILLAGFRKKLPVLFCFMFLQTLITTLGLGLIIPFVTLVQNISYLDTATDISSFGSIKQIIIQVTRYLYDLLNFSNPLYFVLFLGLIFVLFYILRLLFGMYLEYKIVEFSNRAQKFFFVKMFSAHLYMSYTYSLERNIAENTHIVSLSQNVIDAISSLLFLLNDIIFITIASIGLFLWSPIMILATAAIIAIGVGVHRIVKIRILRNMHRQESINRNISITIFKAFSQFVFSKLYNIESRITNQVKQLFEKRVLLNAKIVILKSLYKICIEIFVVTAVATYIVVILWTGKSAVIEDAFTSFVLIAAALVRIIPALIRLLGYLSTLTTQHVNIQILYTEYTQAVLHQEAAPKHSTPPEFKKAIEIKNARYSYPTYNKETASFDYQNRKKVINGVSLTIKKGEMVGFVGESGGGKSTLCNIIMGFLPIQKGSVLIDKNDLYKNIRGWQEKIGYVPQDVLLFNESVMQNIAFGENEQDIDRKKIVLILKKLKLWSTVNNLSKGIDTPIGDFGKQLSGGQKQRIGIARALYRDPEIIVFDEATSNLDTKTELEVQNSINTLSNEKTIIIVAHRINTLSRCDRIYSLRRGKIDFAGTYRELQQYRKETHG